LQPAVPQILNRPDARLAERADGESAARPIKKFCATSVASPGNWVENGRSQHSMNKWIVIVMVLGVGGYFGFKKLPEIKGASSHSEAVANISSATADRKDIRFSVKAAGEIGPAEQVSVKPEINGKIDRLPVDLGDHVKKGDMLVTLDDTELQNQRASIVTEIERSKLQLLQAERNFKRAKELHDANLISMEVFENTKTEYDLARNTLDKSQRELAILDGNLTKTKIVAPFDCTILTRPVSVGQAVSGSGGFNSGTEVLTIADLNSMVINAHINQADIIRLQPNQQVEVAVEAVPGLVITGKVERIAPQATIKNNIKGFAVRILLKDVGDKVRPGMTANITIPVASADNVLAVPLAAVFTDRSPETGISERYVYVKTNDGYERRPVTVGVSDLFYAEVQDGLKAGEVVLLEQPKEEREKQNKELKQAGGPNLPGVPKAAAPAVAKKT
jgi:HlyD family secretion protein